MKNYEIINDRMADKAKILAATIITGLLALSLASTYGCAPAESSDSASSSASSASASSSSASSSKLNASASSASKSSQSANGSSASTSNGSSEDNTANQGGNASTGNGGDTSTAMQSGNTPGSTSGSNGSNTSNNGGGSTSQSTQKKWVEEQGHWEHVLVSETWDEPVYETVYYEVCGTCGYRTTGDISSHIEQHVLNNEYANYGVISQQEQTDTIHHDAIYEDRWVVDVPGHWE